MPYGVLRKSNRSVISLVRDSSSLKTMIRPESGRPALLSSWFKNIWRRPNRACERAGTHCLLNYPDSKSFAGRDPFDRRRYRNARSCASGFVRDTKIRVTSWEISVIFNAPNIAWRTIQRHEGKRCEKRFSVHDRRNTRSEFSLNLI